MNRNLWKWGALAAALIVSVQVMRPQEAGNKASSYAPVDIHETFAAILNRMTASKPEIMRRQTALLEQRYDLSNRSASGATMSRGKPVQEGVRMKLPSGITWEQLAKLTHVDVRGRKDRFLSVHAGTRQIVVPRGHIHLRSHGKRGERGNAGQQCYRRGQR